MKFLPSYLKSFPDPFSRKYILISILTSFLHICYEVIFISVKELSDALKVISDPF